MAPLPVLAISDARRARISTALLSHCERVARVLSVYQQATSHEVAWGTEWYAFYGHTIAENGAWYGLSAEQSVALFAVLSPRRNTTRNFALFLDVVDRGAWHARGITARQRIDCSLILCGIDPAWVVSGPKVAAFYRNLMGDLSIATIDRHAAAAAGHAVEAVSALWSRKLQLAYQSAAALADVPVAHLQATVWVVWRRLSGVNHMHRDALRDGGYHAA